MEDFDALIAELAPLAKAMPAAEGDGKIKKAAEEGGNDISTEGGESGEEGGEDEMLGKSFAVTLPDGSVQEAYDVSDLVKSFGVRLEAAETVSLQYGTDLDAARGDLVKALGVASSLVAIVKGQDTRAKEQDALIKSLQADVARIGNQPVGRRTAVSLVERTAAPLVNDKPNNEQLMNKAMSLVGNGLSSIDVATVEMSLQRGSPLPPHIAALLTPAA